jgi:hypothetical protein
MTSSIIDIQKLERLRLPSDACQILNVSLAYQLRTMEDNNPSLSRRKDFGYIIGDLEKVGVNFENNQAIFTRRFNPDLGKYSP